MRTHLLVFIFGALLFLSGSYFWIVSLEKSGDDGQGGSASNIREAFFQTFRGRELAAEISLGSETKNKEFSSGSISNAASSEFKPVEGRCVFGVNGSPTRSSIIFSEIAWMGDEEDSRNEWIEITNMGADGVSVKNFELIDKDSQIKIVLPDILLGAGEYYLFSRNSGMPGVDKVYDGNLRNSDEALKLFDSECLLLDEVFAAPSWPAGDLRSKKTMERSVADLSWYASLVSGGTPGVQNSFLPPAEKEKVVSETSKTESNEVRVSTSSVASSNNELPAPIVSPPSSESQLRASNIIISEVMAGKTENSSYEFVELYNPNYEAVVLAGWSVKKRSSTGSESSLVVSSRFEGVTIPAQKHLLLANQGGYNGAVVADILWPASYTLAYTNNSLVLYNQNNEKIDEASWNEIPKDRSLARSVGDNGQFSLQGQPAPQNSNAD